MKDENFINKLYETIVIENMKIYKELFNNTNINDVTDMDWKETIQFFNELSETHRDILSNLLKQVIVDSVSSVLAILDGVTFLEGQKDDLELKFVNSNEKLNGYLQDLFLELHEDKNE